MKILIIGAAGMLGRKLASQLASDPHIGTDQIDAVRLCDGIPPVAPVGASTPFETAVSDLTSDGEAERMVADRPDLIFHLAAVLSGEAESDFEKGYRVNLDGTRALFEAIRGIGGGYRPKVVFTSSIAVFGAPYPDAIDDEFLSTPLTSYGTQKAVCELLLADYSRRGYLDGIGIRLPTVCVRPGKPNKAASGFYSNIIREPLNGEEAVLPVSEDVRHWFASPKTAIGFLVQAASLDPQVFGDRRNLSMPGLSVTVGEQIVALRKVAGDTVANRIRREPDEAIRRIVAGWPENFDTKRANALGFKADRTFEEIIRIHIDDEMGGNFVG